MVSSGSGSNERPSRLDRVLQWLADNRDLNEDFIYTFCWVIMGMAIAYSVSLEYLVK